MKRIKFLAAYCCLLLVITASAQQSKLLSFFDSYAGQEDFTTLHLSPKTFEFFDILTDQAEDERSTTYKSLRGLRMLSYTGDSKRICTQLANEFSTAYDQATFEELLLIKDEKTDVRFLVRERSKGVVEELLMFVSSPDSFFFMDFVGQIDLKAIASIADEIEIDGIDHIRKLNNKN